MKIILSNAEYHLKEAVGSTLIREIDEFTVAHAVTSEFKGTADTVWGSLAHAMLFEPESVGELFTIEPVNFTEAIEERIDTETGELHPAVDAFPINKRLKAHREFLATWAEDNAHKEIVTQQMIDDSTKMVASVMAHPIAKTMVTGGEAEYAYFSHDPEFNLDFKCKPDYMKDNALIDLKTSKDARYEEFAREIGKRRYHIQAAYYLDVYNAVMGTKINEFYFVVVEKKYPFLVVTYRLADSDIEAGRVSYRKALKEYGSYLENVAALKKDDRDPELAIADHGYPVEIKTISVPYYMLDKIE